MYTSRLCQIIALALAIFLHSPPEAESLGETAVLNFLEQLRVRMCYPIPQLGLRSLDPLQINHAEGQLNNKYLIDFSGSVTDFNLNGLSEFVINDFRISMLGKSIFNITLPLTSLKSNYTAKGSLAHLLTLAGDGDANAHLRAFNLEISFTIRAGRYLGIRNLSIKIMVGEINMDFENLLEEERINDFFHALVTELGLEMLGDIWKEEKELVEKYIQERVNNFIGKYTLKDIIQIIGGSGGGETIFADGPPGDCKSATTFNEKANTSTNTTRV